MVKTRESSALLLFQSSPSQPESQSQVGETRTGCCIVNFGSLSFSQVIGEDYVKDLSQLQMLKDFVSDAAFIRDVSKVKQVETNRETAYLPKNCNNVQF